MGKVASLTVGGKKLELVSSEIAQDAKERSWIVTKNYGRIRITSAYSGGLVLWLTPSQKESLKALYHTAKSSRASNELSRAGGPAFPDR